MPDNKQWTEVVKKIIALTEAGKLNWTTHKFQPTLREGILGDVIYSANIKGRLVVVYEYQYKSYSDENVWDWENEVAIEFVDSEGHLQWQWPKVPYRIQLLDAIRYKLSGADKFLNDIMSDTASFDLDDI